MPTVPTLSQQPYSTNVPGSDITPNQFGQVGIAAQQLGAAVGNLGVSTINLGNMISEIKQKRAENEAKTFATNKSVDDKLAIQKFSDEDKLSSPQDVAYGPNTPYAMGHTKRVTDYANSLYTASQDSAPNPIARDYYRQMTEKSMMESIGSSQKYENEQAAKFAIDSLDNNNSKLIGSYAERLSNPESVVSNLNLISQMVQDNVAIDPAKKAEKEKELKELNSAAYMQSLENNKQYGTALHILEGKGPDHSVIANALPQKKRLELIESFTKAQKVESDKHSTEYAQAADNMRALLLTEDKYDPALYASIQKNINVSSMEPQQKARALIELESARFINDNRRKLSKLPRSEWGSIVNQYGPNIQKIADATLANSGMDPASKAVFGQALIKSDKAKIDGLQEDIIKAQEKDGAGFVTSNDPELGNLYQRSLGSGADASQAGKEYINKVRAAQKTLGIQNVQSFPEDLQSKYAYMVKNANNADGRLAILNKAQETYGAQGYRELFSEISKKAGLSKDYLLVASVSNQDTKRSMIDNLDNAKGLEKDLAETDSATKQALKSRVNAGIEKYAKVIDMNSIGAENVDLKNMLQRQVTLEATKNLSKEGYETAVDNAVKKIFDANFSVLSSGNSHAMVPALPPSHQKSVQNFMTDSMNSEFLGKHIGIAPSPEQLQEAKDRGINPDEAQNLLVNTVKSNGYWTNTQDGNSLKLMINTPQGRKQILKKDKSGKLSPVIVPINSIIGDVTMGTNLRASKEATQVKTFGLGID